MSDSLTALSQAELLALALDAAKRHDAGHSLAYLKEASARADATAQAMFLLASEYAQIGMTPEALVHMKRAVAKDPSFAIAKFQLGMLQVTAGDAKAARATWAELKAGSAASDSSHLVLFACGMLELVDDSFDAARELLLKGIEVNNTNEPLNVDMRKVVEAIDALPGRAPGERAATALDASTPLPLAAEGPEQAPPFPDVESDVEPSHLFINAYTHRGKPH